MDIGQRWIAEVARGASRSANSSAERDTGRSQSVKFAIIADMYPSD